LTVFKVIILSDIIFSSLHFKWSVTFYFQTPLYQQIPDSRVVFLSFQTHNFLQNTTFTCILAQQGGV